MDLTAQYATALLMTGAGVALSAVYDIYRTSLREWRFLRRFAALFDVSFWLFAVVFVFTMLLGANDGDVRIVVFVLLAIGAFIYYKTAHPLVVASTRLVVRFVYRALRLFCRVLVFLFVTPVVFAVRIGRRVWDLTDRGLLAVEPLVVWPVIQAGRGAGAGARWGARRLHMQVQPFCRRWQEQCRRLSKLSSKKLLRLWSVKRCRKFLGNWLRRKSEKKPDEDD